MRAVLQRVRSASVTVNDETVASIQQGLLALIGVETRDDQADADYMAAKILNLRIFEDASGRMNCAVGDIGGSVLLVSQFTLCADCRKGRRPSFEGAAPPDRGRLLYEAVLRRLGESGLVVQSGVFGANMQVALVNDGPVTILLDSTRQR